MFVRSLEHQMLKKMRDAGFADRIICRAIAIPHHMRDNRCAVIGNNDDFEPVMERNMGDIGPFMRMWLGCHGVLPDGGKKITQIMITARTGTKACPYPLPLWWPLRFQA